MFTIQCDSLQSSNIFLLRRRRCSTVLFIALCLSFDFQHSQVDSLSGWVVSLRNIDKFRVLNDILYWHTLDWMSWLTRVVSIFVNTEQWQGHMWSDDTTWFLARFYVLLVIFVSLLQNNLTQDQDVQCPLKMCTGQEIGSK